MPNLHANSGDPAWDEADQARLSLAWNAFLRGDTDAIDAIDPKDAAVIERLELLARASKPRNAFANQLKEQLMDASVSLPNGRAVRNEPALPPTNPRPPLSIRSGRRWWDSSRRALGAVATIALVVVSLFGGYVAISSLGNGGADPQNGLPGFSAMGTPAASPVSCESCENYLPPSTAPVEVMGYGFINMGDLSEDQRAATNVQLQNWILDPSATAQVPPDTTNGVTGAVVDVVIDGSAVVTIDAPAALVKRNRPGHTPGQNVYYLKAGETTALGPGDVISYPAGHARTIKNPLPMTPLHIKSAVFYAGDVAPTIPMIPESPGLHVKVSGEGTLPKELKGYGKSEVDVELDYIQIHDGVGLPEHRYNNRVDRVLGPVDPVQPESGYVLWIGAPAA